MNCTNCNTELNQNDKFCEDCGSEVIKIEAGNSEGTFNSILEFWILVAKGYLILLGILCPILIFFGIAMTLNNNGEDPFDISRYIGFALIFFGLSIGIAVGIQSVFFYQLEITKKILEKLELFNKNKDE